MRTVLGVPLFLGFVSMMVGCGASTPDLAGTEGIGDDLAQVASSLETSEIIGNVAAMNTAFIWGYVCRPPAQLSSPLEHQKPFWIHIFDETQGASTYLASHVANNYYIGGFFAGNPGPCGANTRWAGFLVGMPEFKGPPNASAPFDPRTIRVYATEWDHPTPDREHGVALPGVTQVLEGGMWENTNFPRGMLERADAQLVSGWACDIQDGPVRVSLLDLAHLGNTWNAASETRIERPDLAAFCPPHNGSYPYGFSFALPADFGPGSHHFVVAAFDSSNNTTPLHVWRGGTSKTPVHIPWAPALVTPADPSLRDTSCYLGDQGLGSSWGGSGASADEGYPPCEGNGVTAVCCAGPCAPAGHCIVSGHPTIADGTCVPSGSQARGPDTLVAGEKNPQNTSVTCAASGAGCCTQGSTIHPWVFEVSGSQDTEASPPEPLYASGALIGDPARVRYTEGEQPFELRVDTWDDPDTTPGVGDLQRCDENHQSIGVSQQLLLDGSSDVPNELFRGSSRWPRTLEKGIWADAEFTTRADFYQFDPVHNATGFDFGGPALSDGWRDGFPNGTAGKECGLLAPPGSTGLYCPGANGRFYTPYNQVVLSSRFQVRDCARNLPEQQRSYLSAYPGTCFFDVDVVPFWDTGTVGGSTTSLCQNGGLPQANGTHAPNIMRKGPGGSAAHLTARISSETLATINVTEGGLMNRARMVLGEKRTLQVPLHKALPLAFPGTTQADLSKLQVAGLSIGIDGWGRFKSAIDIHHLAMSAKPIIKNPSFELVNGVEPQPWIPFVIPDGWTVTCTARGVPCGTENPRIGFSEAWAGLQGPDTWMPYTGRFMLRLHLGLQSANQTNDIWVKAVSDPVDIRGQAGKRLALTAALRGTVPAQPASARISMELLQFDKNMNPITGTADRFDIEEGGLWRMHIERLHAIVRPSAAFAKIQFTTGGISSHQYLDIDTVALAPVETCTGEDDGNPCTVDSCDNGVAVHTNLPANTACGDTNPCNGNEICDAQARCVQGPSLVDDANDCTVDTCDIVDGVQHAPRTGPCTDGNACTQGDTCNGAAQCVGTVISTDDGNPCTIDSCAPATGVHHAASAQGAQCGGGNVCDGAGRCEAPLPAQPPDPILTAPALPAGLSASFEERYQFLYAGPNPVQTPAAGQTAVQIEPKRISIVHGRVTDGSDAPLPSVTVTVLGHPEMGKTVARADGKFDLAVNGGGYLNLVYERPGYFPVHRKIKPKWHDNITLTPVVMVRPDAQYNAAGQPVLTPATLAVSSCNPQTSTCPFIAVHGRNVTDPAGTRRATVLMQDGTGVALELSNGSTQPISTMTIRATEYTDGTRGGTRAMPAELPFGVAYTYAVELSLDEALGVNAEHAHFTRPVPIHVDNFLNVAVGSPVPSGYYDRKKAAWVPSPTGRIIKVTAEVGGKAVLDIDGNGTGDDNEDLTLAGPANLNITDPERAQIALLRDPGSTFSRVLVEHFSTSDFNYGFGIAPCAEGGPCDDDGLFGAANPSVDCEDTKNGSIIECQTRSVGETVPIAGTPFSLNYRSRRTPGYKASREVQLNLSPCVANGPRSSRLSIGATASYMGGSVSRSVPDGCDNQIDLLIGEGSSGIPKDEYGRPVTGYFPTQIVTTERYPLIYGGGQRFGTAGGGRILLGNGGGGGGQTSAGRGTDGCGADDDCTFQVHRRLPLRHLSMQDARSFGVGGWTLDVHHVFHRDAGVLELGSGAHQFLDLSGRVVTTRRTDVSAADMVVGPDGAIYYSHPGTTIGRVSADFATVTPVYGPLGTTNFPSSDDTVHPANRHTFQTPQGLAFGPDGSLYVVERCGNRVRKITPDGMVHTVVGRGSFTSETCSTGTEPRYLASDDQFGLAETAKLYHPRDVAVAADGTLYIADAGNNRVRRVDTLGRISTFAGNGSDDIGLPQTGLALEDTFRTPTALALAPDGAVYIASDVNLSGNSRKGVRRITAAGTVENVVGGRQSSTATYPDGSSAQFLELTQYLTNIVVDSTGVLYFAAGDQIRTVSGARNALGTALGRPGSSGGRNLSGVLALAADTAASVFALAPDDSLYVGEDIPPNGLLRHVHHAFNALQASDLAPTEPEDPQCPFRVPAADREQVYCFTRNGRHLKTLDARTKQPIHTFEYSGELLTGIVDADANRTTIEWDAPGQPRAIVGPNLHRTELVRDANQFLKEIRHPDGKSTLIESTASGLVTAFTDRRGRKSTFHYASNGEVESERLNNGGTQTFEETQSGGAQTVTHTSPLGRKTLHTTATTEDQGQQVRVTQEADGSLLHQFSVAAGQRYVTSQDGTVWGFFTTKDPRFGMTAPVPATTTMVIPGGPTHAVSQWVELVDPPDAAQPDQVIEGVSIEGKHTISVFTEAKNGLPATRAITSPMGKTTTIQYDAQNHVTSLQMPGLAPINYSYDQGRLSRVTWGTPGSGRVPLERQFFPRDGSKANSGYTRFLRSGALAANGSTAVSATAEFDADAFGRLLKQTVDGATTDLAWDGEGSLKELTPPGRPTHVFLHTPTSTTYQPPLLASGATNTLATWNQDGQLKKVDFPDGTSLAYTYGTQNGRLERVASPDGNIDFSYNPPLTCTGDFCQCNTPGCAPGKLESVTGPSDVKLSFGYRGPLLTQEKTEKKPGTAGTLATTTLDWEYDNNLRVVAERFQADAALGTPAYDARTTMAYDDDGLLTCVQRHSTGGCTPGPETQTIVRDPTSGFVTSTTLGNITDTYTYTPFGELREYEVQFTTPNPNVTLYKVTYDSPTHPRDALGRVTRKTEVKSGVTKTFDYTYDARGRLASVTDAEGTRTYTYDANGNRMLPGAVYDSQDRLLSNAGSTYTYSPTGSLRSKTTGSSTHELSYDNVGSTRSAALKTGTTVTTIEYVVDALGRRTAKKVNGAIVATFAYRNQLQLAAELDVPRQTVRRFWYTTRRNAPDFVEERTASTTVLYRIVSDQLGSPQFLIDVAAGTIASALSFDEWGRTTSASGPPPSIGFAGGLLDADTEIVRFGARDYDPTIGRWTNKDPILFRSKRSNIYGYGANDPINRTDPNGLWDLFGFFSGSSAVPFTPVSPSAEVVALGGYNSDSGWYTGDIAALGVTYGSVANGGGYYYGIETIGDHSETIQLLDFELGFEIPWLAGIGIGIGVYQTGSDAGLFLFGHGGILGHQASVGCGGTPF